MTNDIMTPAEALQTAEAQLKELFRSGAGEQEIDNVLAEIEAAKTAIAAQGSRAVQRERLRGEIKREDVRAARLSLEAKGHEAEVAELERAPVVTLEYEGVDFLL